MAMFEVTHFIDYLSDFGTHYFSFWREDAEKVCEDEEDIRGKIVIVTGCNTGIGKQTALQLAKREAVVIMAVRNLEKGQAALDEIKKRLEGRETNIKLMQLDLGDLESIRNFVSTFKSKYGHLDILVNNAGFMDTDPVVQKTKDGFEQHIGVNHLGPFLLTRLLLPFLQKAPTTPSRIVCVSSSNLSIAPINFMDDLMMEKQVKIGKAGMDQYNISKLCNSICMTKFANASIDPSESTGLGDNVKLVQLCPGLVKSDIFRNNNNVLRKVLDAVYLGAVGLSTHQGCETVVYCAISKSVVEAKNSGKGEMYRFKKLWKRGNKILKDYLLPPASETTQKLYNLTEKLVGI